VPAEGTPAIQGDLVRPPRLIQPAGTTTEAAVRIEGYATAGHRIELFVNGLLAGETVVRSTGRFEILNVRLRDGLNIVTAVAVDALGNRSRTGAVGAGGRPDSESTLTSEVRITKQ